MSTINHTHLKALAIFVCVVENGNFAAAARQLQSSRSRVSEQILQLEQALAVRLLQRSTRQLSLTPEGRNVYDHACSIPDILQAIEAEVTSIEPRGRVALTTTNDIAHKVLLPLLAEFKRRYPLIELHLMLNDDRLNLIHEQIDLGIRVGVPKDDSIVARPLFEQSFSIYASPKYLAKNGTVKTSSQLNQHHWIALSLQRTNGILHFLQRGKPLEVKPKSYTLSNSPFMLQQMVVAGLGVGAMFETIVKQELANGELVQLLPSVKSVPITFYLVYPSRRQIPSRIRVLIDYLIENMAFN